MKTITSDYSKILAGKTQLGPYPMEKLKRIDHPTTIITDRITRFDERNTGFARAARGELGRVGEMLKTSSGMSASLIAMSLMSELNLLKSVPGSTVGPSPAGGGVAPSSHGAGSIPSFLTANMTNGKPGAQKLRLPDQASVISRHIKGMAYFAGADVVGICELPQWAVYSHDKAGNPIELNHKYAICIAVDQGEDTMDSSTGSDWISGAQSGRGYALCGYTGHILTKYIRMLGYPAQLHYASEYQVLVPPLLLLSGIGETSRAGIILNPFLGLRFKASVVTTDLPLETDKPVDFGLQDFCAKCKKCALECPSRSISQGDKIIKNGYQNWELNSDSCTKFRMGNPKGISCGRCIKVCPWNKPRGWTHDLVRWMVKHTPLMNDFIIKMDDVWGYGRANPDKQWWFDPAQQKNW